MASAESDDVAAPETEKTEEAVQSPRIGIARRIPWPLVLMLVLAAVVGSALGVGVVVRGRSFGAALPRDVAARPTFVIATPPSPSPAGGLPPRPEAPATTAGDAYTVEAGDSLRSIAERVYGDPAQWPRIYAANRETIGGDPDTLTAGMRLNIPNP